MKTQKRLTLFLASMLLMSIGTQAQWTTDFGKNTQVTPTGLTYDENEVVTNKDGVTYAFFIIQSSGTLDMRLQILDKGGNKLMERGGHSVSREANKPWSSFNQHLALDGDGNAFVGVQDCRTDPDNYLNTYTIYKYSADGQSLWQGSVLNYGRGWSTQMGLSMCGLDDGGCVCAYVYRDGASQDCIAMERLDGDGKTMWNKTLLRMPSSQGSYPYPYLVKGEGDNVLMVYVDNGSTLKARVVDGGGNTADEEAAVVYTGGFASSKTWEVMKVTPGPGNGALVTCMDANENSVFTYVRSDGAPAFPDRLNGITLNDGGYGGSQPSVVYNVHDNTFTCAYQQFNKAYTAEQGLYVKKIGSDGTPVPSGTVEVAGMQSDYMYSFYSVQDAGGGNTALFYQEYESPTRYVDSFMAIYGNDGAPVGGTVKFTGTLTNKQNLRSSAMIDGKYFITYWDEERNGTTSLFMQKVEPGTGTGIKTPENTGGTVTCKTFNIAGMSTPGTVKGINIIRTTQGDGSVGTKKVVVK